MLRVVVRPARPADLDAIRAIYNQGIEDRVATLDTTPKSESDIRAWYADHDERYGVAVAIDGAEIGGWASLNHFSQRAAHDAIADLSVYIERSRRGRGIGTQLLAYVERHARDGGFHKIVLHALDRNEAGKRLYERARFAAVGVFKEHGVLDGSYADVIAMEKLL